MFEVKLENEKNDFLGKNLEQMVNLASAKLKELISNI